ncbi:MAG: hypothetical protein MUF54_07830 [Polyangiaceae bacterium]|nr:hypothetical protein [Polyangiaceae bacterium]
MSDPAHPNRKLRCAYPLKGSYWVPKFHGGPGCVARFVDRDSQRLDNLQYTIYINKDGSKEIAGIGGI